MGKKGFRLSVIVGLLFLGAPDVEHVRAEEGVSEELLTLEESVRIALERNQDVLIAEQRLVEAERALAEARVAFFPVFEGMGTYGRIDEPPSFEVPFVGEVTFLPTESYQAGFVGKQPLFTGGRLTNAYLMAREGVRLSAEHQEAVCNELVFRVKELYYSILVAEKFAEVAEQSLRLLDAHLRDIERFMETGLVARVDLLRTEVQRADAEQRFNSARNAVDLARSAFNNLLDRSLDVPVNVEDVLRYEPRVLALEEATSVALEQRPEIHALEAAVVMAKRGVRLAQAEYFPTIVAQGVYDWEKGTQLEILGEGWHWTVGVSGSMNLWDWGGRRARIAQARAKMKQAELNLEKLCNAVALEVRQAFLKMGEAERNVAVSEKAVLSAQESYRTTEERYREGVGTNTEVLEAETALATAEANRYQALFDYDVAVARLDKAMGVGGRGQ